MRAPVSRSRPHFLSKQILAVCVRKLLERLEGLTPWLRRYNKRRAGELL